MDQTTGSRNGWADIARALLRFSLPLIFSGVLQQLYNWVDAFIVGNVEGETALAAIGATGTVVNFFVLSITGFAVGLAILFAQKFGAGEREFLPRLLSTFALVLGALFVVLAAAGAIFTPTLLRLMRTTADMLPQAEVYLRIVFAGIPFLAVYNVYSAALRGMGDSRAPFLAVLFSSLVNGVLDLLFVVALRWGVAGAAAATVLSQGAMTVFLIGYTVRRRALLRFSPRAGLVDREALALGVRMGLPPMLQSCISAFGSLLLQGFMNGFGTQTVAAITTAYRVDSIVLLPIVNLGAGISTIVAHSRGAKDRRRGKQVLAVGCGLMVVVSLLLTLLVIAVGGPLIALFGVGPQAVAIGTAFFRRIAMFYLVFGLATALRGYLEGQGDLLYSSAAGITSLLCRILASYALAGLWGNMVIAYAEAISWMVLLLLYLARLGWGWRGLPRNAPPPKKSTRPL